MRCGDIDDGVLRFIIREVACHGSPNDDKGRFCFETHYEDSRIADSERACAEASQKENPMRWDKKCHDGLEAVPVRVATPQKREASPTGRALVRSVTPAGGLRISGAARLAHVLTSRMLGVRRAGGKKELVGIGVLCGDMDFARNGDRMSLPTV